MIEIIAGLGVLGTLGATVSCAFNWYTIVEPSEAHLIVTARNKIVVSSDDKVSGSENKRAYFAIPSFIPYIGMTVRKMDITIKEIMVTQETYEENQARFQVTSSTKYRITDVVRAAETFISTEELQKQLSDVIQSSVRAVTVKYNVESARAMKQEMETQIREEMTEDLAAWGLSLVNFQLVNFSDTLDSKIISDISRRREVEIETTTREQNAEKEKVATMKEAAATEESEKRQIQKEKVVGEQNQIKAQKISEMEKIAEEKRYEVERVKVIRQAEIDKAQAIVKAEEDKETSKIEKETKRLDGEGDRLRAEEIAKGKAAPIREELAAEAEGKTLLQAALREFGDDAIRALVAEAIVEKDKAIGVATADALRYADLRVFAGGEGGKQGFNLAELISATELGNGEASASILNRIGRPNDLGLTNIALPALVKDLSIRKAALEEDLKTEESEVEVEKLTTQINQLEEIIADNEVMGKVREIVEMPTTMPNSTFYNEGELVKLGL